MENEEPVEEEDQNQLEKLKDELIRVKEVLDQANDALV